VRWHAVTERRHARYRTREADRLRACRAATDRALDGLHQSGVSREIQWVLGAALVADGRAPGGLFPF